MSFYAYPEKGTGSFSGRLEKVPVPFSEPIFICAHPAGSTGREAWRLRPSADNAVVAFSLTSNTVGSIAAARIAETRQTGKTGIP
ncbi:MAG: hypothetical protein WBD14_07200 [Phycisphaerae bacterium]